MAFIERPCERVRAAVTVFAPMPEVCPVDVTGGRAPSTLSDFEAGVWSRAEDGDGTDTGPYIDPDDEAGDYTYALISDVGHFIDSDAY